MQSVNYKPDSGNLDELGQQCLTYNEKYIDAAQLEGDHFVAAQY